MLPKRRAFGKRYVRRWIAGRRGTAVWGFVAGIVFAQPEVLIFFICIYTFFPSIALPSPAAWHVLPGPRAGAPTVGRFLFSAIHNPENQGGAKHLPVPLQKSPKRSLQRSSECLHTPEGEHMGGGTILALQLAVGADGNTELFGNVLLGKSALPAHSMGRNLLVVCQFCCK